MRTWVRVLATGGLLLATLPGRGLAHGFGTRYELSLPRWLFLAGGAGVVLVSFLVVSFFAGTERGGYTYRSVPLAETPLRVLESGWVRASARVGAVGLLGLALTAGLLGPPGFNENLLTNLVWVGWWVGYTFSVVFIGNSWEVINPWKSVYGAVGAAVGRDLSLDRSYPWGDWPVLVTFLGFAWLEIISPLSESPRGLAAAVAGYSLYLWGGMVVYGRDVWLDRADPFTRLYRYLGKFAPLTRQGRAEVRLYGVGLVPREPTVFRRGSLAFVVAVLYSVTFDGFLATPEWRDLALAAPRAPVPYLTSTVLLLLGFGGFLLAYVVLAHAMAWITDGSVGWLTLARRFSLSLLPIAIVYQVSHFYTFLLVQSQFLVLALADPFGVGWNLLGLGGFEPSAQIPFLSVAFVWQSQVGLIVVGHVIAVWVAHHIAIETFDTRRQAVRSQVPMMGLMIGYTLLSLWILTRPVVSAPLP